MSERFECPADGCDFSAEELGSITSHINPKSDPAHQDKEALRAALAEQSDEKQPESEGQQRDDDNSESGSERDESSSEAAASENSDSGKPESDSEQPEASEKRDSDNPESDEMPTQDELDRQRDQVTSIEKQDESGSEAADSDTTETTKSAASAPSSGGIPLPVSSTTLIAGVALVVMLVLVWAYLSTDGGDDAPAEGADQTGEDDLPDDLDDADGRGLV